MATSGPGLWASSDAYESYMGRWSRRIAPCFLEWLAAAPKSAWLDIGCGPGVLSAAILARGDPERVVGIDASAPFVDAARAHVRDPRFEVRTANAMALPFGEREFDIAVSGLVLNFVSDSAAAVAEMVRVARPGGHVALYVWDYAGHMQIMRHFFDAATAMDARAREFDDGVRAPVCRPGPLGELFEAAGLVEVSVRAIDVPAAFESSTTTGRPSWVAPDPRRSTTPRWPRRSRSSCGRRCGGGCPSVRRARSCSRCAPGP